MVRGKNECLKTSVRTGSDVNVFSQEALVYAMMKLKDDPEKWLKGYSTPCRKPPNESVCDVRTRATDQVRSSPRIGAHQVPTPYTAQARKRLFELLLSFIIIIVYYLISFQLVIANIFIPSSDMVVMLIVDLTKYHLPETQSKDQR